MSDGCRCSLRELEENKRGWSKLLLCINMRFGVEHCLLDLGPSPLIGLRLRRCHRGPAPCGVSGSVVTAIAPIPEAGNPRLRDAVSRWKSASPESGSSFKT